MIFNTFIHYFHSLIDPPNVDELLDAAENAELHEQQFFAWKNDCEIEVERLAFESMGHEVIGPTIDTFFSQLPPVPPDTINIRDVIAFPKTQSATCLLTEAPNVVDESQLEELFIESTHKEED